MGLDIYAGPMSRYFAFTWQTINEQLAPSMGIDVTVIRPPGFDPPSPHEAHEQVIAWQAALGDGFGQSVAWPDLVDGPYDTDKPDWVGYHAVRLLALKEEFPDLALPTRVPHPWDDRWLERQPLERRMGEVYAGRTSGVRRLLGRGAPSAAPRFKSLHLAEMWLPIDSTAVFNTITPYGEQLRMSTVRALRNELEGLNAATYKADTATIERWRAEGWPDGTEFEPIARYALAIMVSLARFADEHKVPIILDY